MSTTITDATQEHTEPLIPPDSGEKNGSGILYREAEYVPRRSWRTWLIGRHLATADAPHQTIGKAVGLAVFAWRRWREGTLTPYLRGRLDALVRFGDVLRHRRRLASLCGVKDPIAWGVDKRLR